MHPHQNCTPEFCHRKSTRVLSPEIHQKSIGNSSESASQTQNTKNESCLNTKLHGKLNTWVFIVSLYFFCKFLFWVIIPFISLISNTNFLDFSSSLYRSSSGKLKINNSKLDFSSYVYRSSSVPVSSGASHTLSHKPAVEWSHKFGLIMHNACYTLYAVHLYPAHSTLHPVHCTLHPVYTAHCGMVSYISGQNAWCLSLI